MRIIKEIKAYLLVHLSTCSLVNSISQKRKNVDQSKICKIRDIYRAISEFEQTFSNQFGICLNEAMVLCALLDRQTMTASELAEVLGVTQSNASKIIRMVEDKAFVDRVFGKEDRRQMLFSLTEAGKEKINVLKCSDIAMPELLNNLI